MPLKTVKFAPGVNAEVTNTLANQQATAYSTGMAQITSSQLIRFRMAGNEVVPEKLGGWQKFYPNSVGSAVRDMHAWEGLRADSHLGIGATSSLTILSSGVLQDVTPRTQTTNVTVSFSTTTGSPLVVIDDASLTGSLYDSIFINTPVAVGGLVLKGSYQMTAILSASSYQITAASNATSNVSSGGAVPTFTTTNGSPAVTVTLAAHGYVVGQTFNIPTTAATTVGGLTLSGAYLVQSVSSSTAFVINSTTLATSSVTSAENGGKVQIIYYIGVGPAATSAGYGVGGYGTGGYGLGVVPAASLGTPITATNWSLDNWGEIFLACPANGAIYAFSPDSGLQNATKVVGAPAIQGGMFVAQPAQILVSWASSQDGVQDPLTINWSDAGDYTNWAVTSQTQAGGYHISTGSHIVGGCSGPNFNIIWTDVDVWAMDYIEPPLVFGFNALGSNCGMIGRHAFGVLNSTVFWMSNDKFCLLNGETVQTIPCPVWDVVFQNLDLNNVDKIYCGTNTLFDEVTFFYPSLSGGGEVDSYVKIGVGTNAWDYGKLQRTAWIDQSSVGQPIGADANGYIYEHETSPDADGQPMNSWFQTGFFEIAEGEQLNFVDWILPDFKFGYYAGASGAILQISLLFSDYPNAATKVRGPYSVSSTTSYVNTRLRARLIAMRIGSTDLGSFWRLGALKIRSAPDGKR